jgi:hypothetical protein
MFTSIFQNTENEFRIVLVFANGLPIGHWLLCLQITLNSVDCIISLRKQNHVYICHVSCHLCLAKE